MKKLMTMIAAVATAFGLYTANAYDGTSFEGSEAGVGEATWTPSGVWSSGITDAFDLGAYNSEKDPAYTYGPTVNVRRNDDFTDGDTQTKYLKLETGSATLDRSIADGQVYFDQLVKFTGFEEAPEFTGEEKIAIWASAIEADETVDPVIVGDTNLYVAVGTANGQAPIKNVKINVAENFDFNAWHRLTIKQLDAGAGTRAGFLIWIDGNKATTSDKYYADEVPAAWSASYTAGELFLAMDNTSAAVSTVSYKGIGSIDDVVVSATAPDFAEETPTTVTLTVTIPENTVLTITNAAGEVISHVDGVAQVAPGTKLWLVFTAADGYIMDPVTKEITIGDANADVSYDDIIAKPNVTLSWNDGTESASYADLATALARVAVLEETTEGEMTLELAKPIENAEVSGFGMVTMAAGSSITISSLADGRMWIFASATIAGTVSRTLMMAEGSTLTIGEGGLKLAPTGEIYAYEDLAISAVDGYTVNKVAPEEEGGLYTYTAVEQPTQAFVPSAKVVDDLATAIAYIKDNYYNKHKNGEKIPAPDASFVKVGTLASDVTGTVSIGGTAANADEKFSLSIGNNAFLESAKFKIVGREVYVAAVILAIEQVKVTANAKDYQIDSAKSGQLALESFAAVAPTTIAGEGTKFTIVRGDDKPLVKFFFTDTVTEYFVTKKTFIDKNEVATTSYGFTTPDEGGLWLYLGYGVGLGGNWDGVTYNYTVYAFGVDKKAITLSMSITDKAIQPPTPTYTVTFSTNTVAVAEKTLTDVESGTQLAANQIPDFGEGTWDVQPLGAIITSNTNFNFTVKVDPIPPLPAEPTADDVNAKVDAAKFADSTVKTMIGGDPTKYNAFKTWAGTVTGGEAAVVASAHAADSYLLGQTTLLENAPVSEIKTIAKTSDTALTLTFEIKDGANAVTVAQTAADYVKGLVQCNEKVDFGNGTKIDATVTVTINGQTLTAAVTLPANKPAAFMKVAK